MGLSKRQKEELKRKRNYTCELCEKQYDRDFLVIHHRIPRPEFTRLRETFKPVKQDWISELLWGKKWERIVTKEVDPDYNKESNLVVLCFKCHKKLDKLTSHGKTGRKKKEEKEQSPRSPGLTGEDVYEIVFGKRRQSEASCRS